MLVNGLSVVLQRFKIYNLQRVNYYVMVFACSKTKINIISIDIVGHVSLFIIYVMISAFISVWSWAY